MTIPSFTAPDAPDKYDRENEAQFRREVERMFQSVAQYTEGKGLTGTPATLSAGSNNNYAAGQNTILRLTPDATGSTITGIVAPRTDKSLKIVNLGSADLTLAHQSGSSTDINRLITSTAADVVLLADQTADLTYDTDTSRWRVAGSGAAARTAVQSETLASGSTNNLALNDDTLILLLTADAGGSTLTGITGGAAGRALYVQVVAAPVSLTLAHESGSSTESNRLLLPTNGNAELLGAFGGALLVFDGTAARWRLIGKPDAA